MLSIATVIAIVAATTAKQLRRVTWLSRAARTVAATAMGALAVKLALAERRYPNSRSMLGGGCVKNFGPASVMYQQSSSRTPNLPGM
jgi:hypothetical protein